VKVLVQIIFKKNEKVAFFKFLCKRKDLDFFKCFERRKQNEQ